MKHSIKHLTMVITMFLSTLLFTACPDNPDGPDADDEPTPTPDPIVKVKLDKIRVWDLFSTNLTENRYFSYNDYDRIDAIRSYDYASDYGLFINWDNNTIKTNDAEMTFTLNSNGYISLIVDNERPARVTKFKYDKDGHMIRGTFDNGYYDLTVDYVWEDDLMVLVKAYEEEYDDSIVCEISYGNEKNISGIWPVSFNVAVPLFTLWDCPSYYKDCDCFLQTGLLGVAPKKLPIAVNQIADYWWYKYEIVPEINDEGFLAKETVKHKYGKNSLEISYEGEGTINYVYE